MIDIVMNHMSDNEIPTFYPFNKPEHFHDCIGCKGCDIDFAGSSCGYQSTWSVEHCQLAGGSNTARQSLSGRIMLPQSLLPPSLALGRHSPDLAM